MNARDQSPSGHPRARAIGIPFAGEPGALNSITDVTGVKVGYQTLIRGESVRTGVTAILPRQQGDMTIPVFAGCHSLNGNGELSGTLWIEEAGRMDGPITITNTHSCGVARDAAIKWMVRENGVGQWALPVAGETFDGWLNDINGFHVTEADVLAALDNARAGPLEEGSVGGGTGMICYGYKGGSGTASRVLAFGGQTFTVGVFVQANFGRKDQLVIAGVPVGRMLNELSTEDERGSIIGVVATDAPLMPHQLKRFARRMGLGMGRSGAISGHGSGDIFLAFSTANAEAHQEGAELRQLSFVPNDKLDPFFTAVIQATDEAIMNAMVVNEPMTGFNGYHVDALPLDDVVNCLQTRGAL